MGTHDLIHTETLQIAEMQVRDLILTPLESRFNRLARMTQRALGTRVAAISFLNKEGEWFKAVTGWNVAELPAARSLASTLLADRRAVAIADLTRDERTRNHPLVQASPKFRFAAVSPINDRFGHMIGAIAVYDTEPHEVTVELAEAMTDAGELAQRELLLSDVGGLQQKLLAKLDASRRQALLDELTRLWNRRGGMVLLEQALESARRYNQSVGVCIIDVDDFKLVNDRYGHKMGDVVLRKLAAALVDSIRPDDFACRLGGDEFMLLMSDITAEQFESAMERVRQRVRSLTIRTRNGDVRMSISVGGILPDLRTAGKAEDILHQADLAMYQVKGEKPKRAVGMSLDF
ncbi:MAG: diguanylate cyclase [Steroidobacteraceae bacterium]